MKGQDSRWFAPALALLILGICGLLTPAAQADGCPNDAFRVGPSAALPDCRAYELVSPADTDGRVPYAINRFALGSFPEKFPTELGSPYRDSFLYLTFNEPLVFPEEANGAFDIYEAVRSSGGWETVRQMSRNGESGIWPAPGGVSADHTYGFVRDSSRSFVSKPDGSYELTGVGSLGQEPFAEGRFISPGGNHILFTTGHGSAQSANCFAVGGGCPVLKLEPDAPQSGTGAIYDRSAGGPTHVISLLPPSQTPAPGEEAFFQGVSADGSVVAFKIAGALYVRVDNAVTKLVTAEPSTFAGLSANGSRLFYVSGSKAKEGNITLFDVASGLKSQLNGSGDAEIVNVSADGSHVYFVSKTQLDGSEGTAGEPNLYVWRGGAPEYIATVSPDDLNPDPWSGFGFQPGLNLWTSWAVNPEVELNQGPGADTSRSTPDGTVLVFESHAQLSGYENDGHTEIYRYEDGAGPPTCVSCNPLEEPATQDARLQELRLVPPPIVIHNVTDDGTRVFFETEEGLVDGDIDGVNDVYEWRQEGLGGGTAALISSGRSSNYPLFEDWGDVPPAYYVVPNVLVSVTPSGNDVFFLSQDQLTSAAGGGGAAAVYDARVGGGFSAPHVPMPCENEGCRPGGANPPQLQGPASDAPQRGGNVRPRKHRRHCHRAKHKRKHCSTRHHKKRNKRARAGASSALVSAQDQAKIASSTSLSAVSDDGSPETTQAVATSSLQPGSFGIEDVTGSLSTSVAAAHPDFTSQFHVNPKTLPGQPKARIRDAATMLPPGLIGNPTAVPRCETGQFVAQGNCPFDSQVGVAKIDIEGFGEVTEPLYNLLPPHPDREVARLAFMADLFPVFIDVNVRTAGDYGLTATVHGAPGLENLLGSTTTIWSNPTDSSHDPQRMTTLEAKSCFPLATACKAEDGKREVPRKDVAFMTNPSACQEQTLSVAVTSYQLPGLVFQKTAPMTGITDCQGLPFAPTLEAEPTSHVAGAPTGLETKLRLPQHLGVEERATATMREARVTLPAGMQIAAGAANWIGTCSEAQVGFHEEVDAKCPDASKLGTVKLSSPSLPEPLEGALYQRTPSAGHQFGLWLASDALGLHVKIPGELQPDGATGRLTAVFRDLPQVPVEEIDLNVWGGPRAPLQNPSTCGTYPVDFSFAPHSQDPAVTGVDQVGITEGCDRKFGPRLDAGVTKPIAGTFSPLIVDLSREDDEQALRGFELELPDGELAKIKGVPLCADGAAAPGNCPTDSAIGHLLAAAGPGPEPLWVPQPGKAEPRVYLGGPYEGSPFSIVTVVPAQAGPFDLGNVVVRSGLALNPDTNRAVIKADPLPQFFEGVGLAYRRLHVVIDRPNFSVNPTDCRPMAVESTVSSVQGAVAHPSTSFQVGGCKRLRFKPKLMLELKGGTRRTDYPALTAVLKARSKDANLARTSVALPHSEFLAQEHIATICTRKQFAADKCPKGSVYGKAVAYTPLLAKPLKGPVYLRSSDNPLPDLVAALGGELDVNLVGRIDSDKAGGIRTTFERIPDAPVTKFVLKMRGGKKSLLVNSTGLCRHERRATVQMNAQNGRSVHASPVLKAKGCRDR